jgi:hypothetical protein
MLTDWRLREEILALTHAWHLPLLAFLLGALLGWGAAFLLPTPYRAESSMNVMYNADAQFRNPDDYKNWQMDTLELLILSDGVLESTLERLRAQDPSWEAVTPAELRPRLHTYWRNAGMWRLAAEDRDPDRAQALAQAWGEASLEGVQNATSQAQTMLELEARTRRLANEKVDLAQRTAKIAEAQAALEAWRSEVSVRGDARPLEDLERWRLLALAARLVGTDPAGRALLDELPAAGTPTPEALSWVERALVYAGDQASAVQAQLAQAGTLYDEAYQQLDAAYKASAGLTAFLRLEPLPGDNPRAQAVRPTAITALIGGLLGLLAWALVWLGRPLLRAGRGGNAQPAGKRASPLGGGR